MFNLMTAGATSVRVAKDSLMMKVVLSFVSTAHGVMVCVLN